MTSTPGPSIETVRQYWNRQPCNINHSLSAVGSDKWSEEITERKYFVEPHIKAFADFPRWTNRRVLEIGCGLGTDTLEFVKAGAIVDAIDISSESIRLAEHRLRNYRGVRFFLWNAENPFLRTPMHRYGYHLVYSFGVLHHTLDPLAVLENARREIAPKGELRIMVYAKRSLKFWMGEQPEAQPDCPFVRTYTAKQVRRMLKLTGFEAVSIRKTHIFPWRVSDYIEHRYVKRGIYRYMPAHLFRLLERICGHHLLVIARPA